MVPLVLACSGKKTTVLRTDEPAAVSVTGVRVLAFVGQPVVQAGLGGGDVSPALPAGLVLDDAGRLSGIATTPARSQLYRVQKSGSAVVFHLEVVALPGDKDRVVSPSGSDDAPGSIDRPLRTIRKALAQVGPGATIFLRGGTYAEDVRLTNTHDLVLRGYPGEAVTLAGDRLDLEWTRAVGADAAPDEWVSTSPVPLGGENLANRGAFLERLPYTRLLTYGRVEDLRATNERWVLGGDAPAPAQRSREARPWTYFGPGIWHDTTTGILHLRLSPTHNQISGLADFEGATKVPAIGVWHRASTPLRIQQSSGIEVHDLTVFGGGERSVDIEKSTHVLLDHVEIRGASESLSIRHSTDVGYAHGKIDGGVPPWTFRSDYKDNYQIETASGLEPNNLIRKTSRALLAINDGNREISISYCEIERGHDLTFSGIGSELHHCRIRDIQDDALFISHTTQIDNLRIHDNVFERVMTAFSGEGRRETGSRYIYRNVFDLREPVPGWRPGIKETVWRYGTLFKGDFSAGPLYFYHNTVLLNRPGDQIALALFRSLERSGTPIHARWFVGNVVSVNTDAHDQSLAFIPQDDYLTARRPDGSPLLYSDGNLWVRPSSARAPMFKCITASSSKCATRSWSRLSDLASSRGRFERSSKSSSAPPFVRLKSATTTSPDDDLRLATSTQVSPLPQDLPDSSTSRETGALSSKVPFYLGVDGRLRY